MNRPYQAAPFFTRFFLVWRLFACQFEERRGAVVAQPLGKRNGLACLVLLDQAALAEGR
jgi:hypothetical protein